MSARHASRNLQEHLARLEQAGLLVRISEPINKDTEAHPLVRWQFRGLESEQRKAFLFDNVTDSKGRKFEVPLVVGALAASPEIYALAFGLEDPDTDLTDIWRDALANPVPPRVVDSAPCQEVVLEGAELQESGGLEQFPIPISTPGFDNAPYLTSAIWVTKDPETGERNAAVYRGMVKGPLSTGVFTDSDKHGARMWEKCNRLGKPLEAAAVIGSAPTVYFSAVEGIPYGVDELAVAGRLQGEPVDVVKCKTVDLLVPAEAQIVLEGRIRTDVLEPEGSFGEAHGYSDPRTISPVFEVTCITYRRDAVYMSIISQVTPSESSGIKQTGYQAQALRFLRNQCELYGVKQVVLPEDLLNQQYAVVVMEEGHSKYEPMNALLALQTLRRAPKFAVAVDEDIDATNETMVNWAIINRSQPHKDLQVIHPRKLPFGPLRLAAGRGDYDRDDSSIIIDATKKGPLPPVSLPAREFMEQSRARWEQLGLPPLRPRTPWYGYELGMWPAEAAEEADAAVRGHYDQTGAMLSGRRVPAEPGTILGEARQAFNDAQ